MLPDQAIMIDDDLWERLSALTDGAAALCYQCGVCTASCPWGAVKQQPLSVRRLIRQAQIGWQSAENSLWLCTTCAQCEELCPRGVKVVDIFRSLRSIAWENRSVAPGLPTILWSLYWDKNPWTQPPSQRADWAKNLDIPVFDPEVHEVLLYAGCTSSYIRRAQKIATALVQILRAAGVQFGYLGVEEPCCGEAALSVGHQAYFQEIASATSHYLRGRGVAKLVTISPHCYDVFKNHYPQTGANSFTAIHYTQFLAELITQGRLRFTSPWKADVTFQDPCYLGRHNGEYTSPREVLTAIPGLQLAEMPNAGAEGLCCGGGGGRMWLETPAGERFGDLRVAEAASTGAQTLVTACPFCLICLEDSVKAQKMGHLQILDVAEVAASCL